MSYAVIEYQDTEIFSADERLQRAIGPFAGYRAAQAEAEKLERAEHDNPSDPRLVYSVITMENPNSIERNPSTKGA